MFTPPLEQVLPASRDQRRAWRRQKPPRARTSLPTGSGLGLSGPRLPSGLWCSGAAAGSTAASCQPRGGCPRLGSCIQSLGSYLLRTSREPQTGLAPALLKFPVQQAKGRLSHYNHNPLKHSWMVRTGRCPWCWDPDKRGPAFVGLTFYGNTQQIKIQQTTRFLSGSKTKRAVGSGGRYR